MGLHHYGSSRVLPSSPATLALPAWAGGSLLRMRALSWYLEAGVGTSGIITITGTSKVWGKVGAVGMWGQTLERHWKEPVEREVAQVRVEGQIAAHQGTREGDRRWGVPLSLAEP